MNLNHDRNYTMTGQDILTWRPQVTTTSNMSTTGDEEIMPADLDEPPELQSKEFIKAPIRPQNDRAESLLTRGLKSPEPETQKPDIHITTDLMRRRSLMSTASLASTAELTSDGGFTSPARTNTPSPPFPNTSYYSMSRKPTYPPPNPVIPHEAADPIIAVHKEILNVSPKAAPVVPLEAAPKKRCISFACGARKDPAPKSAVVAVVKPLEPAASIVEAPKRKCTIKFACPSKPTEKHAEKPVEKVEPTEKASSKLAFPNTPPPRKRLSSRSPSTTRKPRPTPTSSVRPHRESTGTIRRASQSPVAIRCKPKYVIAGEEDLQSEAARFHEFCSEGLEEDDWIRKDEEVPKAKITINDTLAKEIEIRKLGSEAEEEALEEDDDEDFDDRNDSDDEDGSDEEQDDDYEGDETDRVYSDDDDTDGNETDNEAGFADSDDEDDTEGDFNFWTPGRLEQARFPIPSAEVSTYRASANRTASASSIESLNGTAPISQMSRPKRKSRKTRSIKIRPGTPDLPDSTDFVCGTLDEDRPLEDAYVSCMTARKYAKHIATPQDIDPSFPTSDPEDEEDEVDDVAKTIESDEHVWMQGKFEDSDSERRRARSRRSPGHSPRRLHSPPPPKQRLRSPPPKQRLRSPPPKKRLQSPPPRKLFGNESPKRLRSPPPARTIHSPPAPPPVSGSKPIKFAPLGSRPGLTHTKSLPRTPNAFCRQYTASRIAAANEIAAKDDGDGPLRGAIDIVKGLEQKRQRRKEKFYQKHCANRARKAQPERRPQPGKGAERMRELGLLMAGKTGTNDPYMLSA